MKKLLALGIISITLIGCEGVNNPTSDQVQKQQQEALSSQSNSEVGMPAIANFQEKRILKDILERRDKVIVTITYTQDMNGYLHKLCDSVGYGISAATQYTNPQRIAEANRQGGYAILPQADPNGLFSPSSAEGTWVMCKDPHSGRVEPIYSEPRLIVSTFPL